MVRTRASRYTHVTDKIIGTTDGAGGLQIQLTGDLPSKSSFLNTNRTLTPPNIIMLASGFGFVNHTTLTSYVLDTVQLPFTVKEKTWHRIKTEIDPKGFLTVSVNGRSAFKVALKSYSLGGKAISPAGSLGFGAWQDQAAFYRNVVAYDTASRSEIYRNPLTSQDILAEYGTQANLASVCLDGPKRDRLVWLGDFYHTSRIIGASTGRFDHTRGTLDFILKTQLKNRQLSLGPSMGYDPSITHPFAPYGVYGLDDYRTLGFLSFYHYMRRTNDVEFA